MIHLAKPGSLAIDASIFGGKEAQVSFRVSVVEILKDGRGDFSLQGGPDIPLNVFLDADGLAKRLWGDDQRRNALLIGSGQQNIDMADAQAAIGEQWSVEDAGLTLRQWGEGPSHNVELASRRVFLDDAVARAAQNTDGVGVLTWFASELRADQHATPYSFVAGWDRAKRRGSRRCLRRRAIHAGRCMTTRS